MGPPPRHRQRGCRVGAVRHVAPLVASAAPAEYARLTALVAVYTGLPADTVTGLVLDTVLTDLPDPA